MYRGLLRMVQTQNTRGFEELRNTLQFFDLRQNRSGFAKSEVICDYIRKIRSLMVHPFR